MGGASDEFPARFLALHSTKNAEKISQHDSMRELGFVVDGVDFTAVFWNARKWRDEIEGKPECGIDINRLMLRRLVLTLD